MKRLYETIFIVDSNKEADPVVDKLQKKLKSYGADVINLNRWGKKRFAYEIKKRQYGDYTSIEFELDSNKLVELENEFRINEDIIRSLTYRISEKQMRQRKKDIVSKENKEAEKQTK